jgi:hypothetical protein
MVDKTNRRQNAAKKTAAGTPAARKDRVRAAKATTEILAVTLEEMAGRRIAGGRDTEAATAEAPENQYPGWTLALVPANDDHAPTGPESDTRGKINPYMDTVEIGDCGPWFSANEP